MRRFGFKLAVVAAGTIFTAVLFAGFFSPYDPAEQDRMMPYAPPTRLHLHHENFRWGLHVCSLVPSASALDEYREDCRTEYGLSFFVHGAAYKLAGLLTTDIHLFGVNPRGRIYLLGTDGLGRDQFSRLLYGGRISLFAGLLATGLALAIGTLLGVIAGYFGGFVDDVLMRVSEFFVALPWLYLLLAVRAFLPLHIEPETAFLLLIAIIGCVGWARPARLVRGVALSGRERTYVLAARGFGASNWYLIRRHVLPQAFGVVLTQAALLIPQYVLAEVTLSFLGLGVGEPAPSWGNMLAVLQQYHALTAYWWLWFPVLALLGLFLAFNAIADAAQNRLQSQG